MTTVDTSTSDASAKAAITAALDQFGLGSLAAFAWGEWQKGIPVEQIMLDIRATPDHHARFPAMAILAKQGRAITESQYISYEQSAYALAQSVGLDTAHFNATDITNLLTNNVALPELKSRLDTYQAAAYSTPPEFRAALQQLYGVTPGQLTAYFIDPDRALPIIQQQWAAAQAAGEANLTGYGALNKSQAETLAAQGLTAGQLGAGFAKLGTEAQVFAPLPGNRGEQTITVDQQLAAQFENNVAAQQTITQQEQSRLAEFKAGGTVARANTGAFGAGVAQ